MASAQKTLNTVIALVAGGFAVFVAWIGYQMIQPLMEGNEQLMAIGFLGYGVGVLLLMYFIAERGTH